MTDFGVDLGSARTVIVSGKQVLLNEPSVIAIETHTGEPVAFGQEAYEMIGRTPDRITALCPIERGVIADYDVVELLAKHFLSKVSANRMLKPRVMVSMPSGVTAVQHRSVIDAVTAAGARNVCMIEAPLAAAIGNDVDFTSPRGTIIVDVGAGATDVAVLSMGGLAKCESARVAGCDFDDAITRYVRKECNVLIGPRTAENIKKTIGCVTERPFELAMTAKGRNLFTGLPQAFEITASQVCTAVADTANAICKAVQSVLENTPPELIGDIITDGVLLSGNGSLIRGFDEYLAHYTHIKVRRAPEPKLCVAFGTGRALRNMDLLKNGDYAFRTLQDLAIE